MLRYIHTEESNRSKPDSPARMQGVEGMQKLGCNAFRNNCNSLAWKQGGVDKCTYFDGIVHDCNILLPHVLFILEDRKSVV